MKKTFFVMVISTLMIAIAGGLSLWFLNSPAAVAKTSAQAEAAMARTITVVGEGRVSTAPDIARINLGVETLGPDVKQASSDAAGIMQALLDALAAQGVADNDIQTSYYNIWVERPYGGPDGGLTGEIIYHVNNTVSITIRDLSKVTDILSAVLDAGANTVNSIEFNVADPSQLRSEARQKAVDDALATAQELAQLNGVEIGQVVSVSEAVTPSFFPVAEAAFAQGVGGGGPISPGEVEISTQLQVTYEIK